MSCMYFDKFVFTPQALIAASQQIFGVGFGTSDMQRLSAAVTVSVATP